MARQRLFFVFGPRFRPGPSEAPRNMARQRLKKSRPISRVLSLTVIPLAYASPRSSSDLPGSPCGPHVAAKTPLASLFGLAPGGVCRAARVATSAVRSYRTISPLPAPLAQHLGGIFLLHFPWARAPQALPGTVPCGARTFLHVPLSTQRLPGRLLGRTILLFQLQRPLVSFVAAHRGDLRGQMRRLLQRQFGQERLEHAIERAHWPRRPAPRTRSGPPARGPPPDLAARKIRLRRGPRRQLRQRTAIQR